MQLYTRQWYILLMWHPIHLEKMCEMWIFIELEEPGPGNIVLSFCRLLFADILLQFLNTF